LVHVDSLPADLRKDWYLERGIELHKKVNAKTGETVLIPDQSFERDARYDKAFAVARWRHDVVRPALALPRQSGERRAKLDEIAATTRLHPNGKTKCVTRRTLEYWVKDFENDNAGLNGLIPKVRSDKGVAKTIVTRVWDGFFTGHISAADHAQVGDDLIKYIRSMWASGARGNRAVSEQATTRLIEISRALGVVSFETLPLGYAVGKSGTDTQFGLCCVNRRMAEDHRKYGLLAIKARDNATFQDKYMPSIRRDYSDLVPRDMVVGDVHPIDIMCRRIDGSQVYPKGIAWFDPCTNEMHMTFVFHEKGEGVRRDVKLVITISRDPLAGRASFGCPRSMCLRPSRACYAYPAGQRYLTTDMPFWRIHCLAGDTCIAEKEPANQAVTNVQPQLLQFFGHSGATVALQA